MIYLLIEKNNNICYFKINSVWSIYLINPLQKCSILTLITWKIWRNYTEIYILDNVNVNFQVKTVNNSFSIDCIFLNEYAFFENIFCVIFLGNNWYLPIKLINVICGNKLFLHLACRGAFNHFFHCIIQMLRFSRNNFKISIYKLTVDN